MKRKDNRTLNERAKDLEKVLTFSILKTVEKYYGTVERFKTTYFQIKDGKATSQSQVEFCKRFGFDTDTIRKILGSTYDNSKRTYVKIREVIPYFSPWFHYQRHFKKQYKSGKCYQVHGYWYIDFTTLDMLMKNPDVFKTDSDFYTQRQHMYIDRLILKFKLKENMTVSESIPLPSMPRVEIPTEEIPIAESPTDLMTKMTENYLRFKAHARKPQKRTTRKHVRILSGPSKEEIEEFEEMERQNKLRREEHKKQVEEETSLEDEIPQASLDEILNGIGNI